MSLFKLDYEWQRPKAKTPLGKNMRNKKDGKPSAMQHYSVNERRIDAIIEEGKIARLHNIFRDQNPKVSNQSREAWFKGWDTLDL